MANDPNTIQYVIQEDGFWYVASKDRTPGVPEITVSAKGVANGLSTEYNDGYDFGPDSYNPSVTSGVPLTQTSGIQEAWDYAVSIATLNPYNGVVPPAIHLASGGLYNVNTPILFTAPSEVGQMKISGTSSMAPYIAFNMNNAYGITVDPHIIFNNNIRWENMQFLPGIGFSPYGAINIDCTTVNSNANVFEGYNIDISVGGWTQTPVQILGFRNIILYNYESYSNTGSLSSGGYFSALDISVFGGKGTDGSNGIRFDYSGTGSAGTLNSYGLHSAHQIGGWALAIIDTAGQIYLNNNIGFLKLHMSGNQSGSNTNFISPFTSGDTWTINTLSLDGTLQSDLNLLSPNVKVDQFENHMNYNGHTVNNLPFSAITVTGSTAGSFDAKQILRGVDYKKIIIYLNGYENDSTTAQTYTYPVPFSTVAAITSNTASVPVVSTSLTEFSIAPDTATAYTGLIIIEGY